MVKHCRVLQKWTNLSGNENELAEKLVSLDLLELSYQEAREKQPDIRFHATCYRRYIDSKRLAEKHCKQVTPFEKEHSPPKKKRLRVRVKSASSSVSLSSSGPILPAKCIICKKVDLLINVNKKRVRDKLRQASSTEMNESVSLDYCLDFVDGFLFLGGRGWSLGEALVLC